MNLLVLGASSDIAKECSIIFGQKGFSLSLACRNPHLMSEFTQTLYDSYKIESKTYKFDILKLSNHKELLTELKEPPDGVICFIGYYGINSNASIDVNERTMIINSNYVSVVNFLTTI